MSPLRPKHAVVAALVGGAGAMMGSCLAGILIAAVSVLGSDASVAEGAASTPAMLGSIAASSLLLMAVAFATPAIARVSVRDSLGLRSAPWPLYLLVPFGTLALSPLSDLLMQLMARVAPELTFGGLESLIRLAQENPPWLLLPFVALLPGFGEELFFRGMLQRAFGRGALAVSVSALAFAVIHLDPHHVAGVLPLGFFLAWSAARAASTWPSIVAHVVNNTAAMLAPRIAPLDVGYGTDRPMPWWAAAIGLALAGATAALVGWLTRRRQRSEARAAGPPGNRR